MWENELKDYKLLLFSVALMWCLGIVAMFLSNSPLSVLAVLPRELDRAYAIFSMHFLHWGLSHLVSNTLPLLVLGFFVCSTGKAKQVTITIAIFTGLLVWLFARPGAHAGASGLVMGYWGFLISHALFERSLKNFVISALTIVLYGGIVYSLLDFRATTSFEGHLFGFIVGVISAKFYARKN
jgi:membrane associated rhomboid family serine protease